MSLSSPASWAADMNFQSRYPGGIVVTMTCLDSLLSCPNDRRDIHAAAHVRVTTAKNENAIRFIGFSLLLRVVSRPQRPERGAPLIGEDLRRFPRREMAAIGRAAVMQKLRERPFGPTLRRRIYFAGVRAHADGNGDSLGVKEARLRRLPELPIEPGR